jgi:hypothetical protein
MSSPTVVPQNPTVTFYDYRLGQAQCELEILSERSHKDDPIRTRFKYLHFCVKRLRADLPKDGGSIAESWWQAYARVFAIVEDLNHEDFDDDLIALWYTLPDAA